MIGICVLAAVLVLTGAAIGILAVVSVGIRREEQAFSLTMPTPDPVARGVRRLTGVYIRLAEVEEAQPSEAGHRHDASAAGC